MKTKHVLILLIVVLDMLSLGAKSTRLVRLSVINKYGGIHMKRMR